MSTGLRPMPQEFPSARMLDRFFGAPAPLRTEDLLPLDQPLRARDQQGRSWRHNGFVRLLAFAVIMIVGGLAVAFVVAAVINSLGRPADESWLWAADWMHLAVAAGAVVAYWLVARFVEQRQRIYELASTRALGGLVSGVGLGVFLMAICAGLLAMLGVLRFEGFDPSYSPWAALLGMGVAASVSEEILFRGLLFRLVEGSLGTWAAVVISALFFGAVHLGNPEATMLGAVGIALEAGVLFAALYTFTRSLWTVMGLHFAWNVTQGPLLGMVVSGSAANGSGFVRSQLIGPQWLSGGQFGIEASAVTIVLLTGLGVWILVAAARRNLVVRPFWVRRRLLAQK